MASATTSIADTCAAARRAARTLAALPSAIRDGAREAIAEAIVENGDTILDANQLSRVSLLTALHMTADRTSAFSYCCVSQHNRFKRRPPALTLVHIRLRNLTNSKEGIGSFPPVVLFPRLGRTG